MRDHHKRKFNFKKMLDFHYLFLVTAEQNIRYASRGAVINANNANPLDGIEYYAELYNDCIYEIPYDLFVKNLKKEIAKVTLLTEEHRLEILKEYDDVLRIMPPLTRKYFEKIINGPFDLKRLRSEKKKSALKMELFLKDYFLNEINKPH